jgi:uncharacterized membrane protein YtjA (UPF0391 family)
VSLASKTHYFSVFCRNAVNCAQNTVERGWRSLSTLLTAKRHVFFSDMRVSSICTRGFFYLLARGGARIARSNFAFHAVRNTACSAWCGPLSGAFSFLSGFLRAFIMLYYALVFFVIALVAAALGFGGIAAGAASIAKILFFVFLVIFLVTLVMGMLRR